MSARELDVLTVPVELGDRSYRILIGHGILASFGRVLTETVPGATGALVVADENTAEQYGRSVVSTVAACGLRAELARVPAGERAKRLEQAHLLYERLYRLGADRRTVVVAVGGGVVGDLAGFVAATFARGLPFVQVPTTLLAQVDASVGGKTAVNFEAPDGLVVKNLIGAFYQPALVYIDVATLKTLPHREYRSGLAEVVKYGVILDEEFFGTVEQKVAGLLERDAEALALVIARCCEIKAQVVQADEREQTGYRAILNLGHTFAHAIEALTEDYLHGEAVAIGMVAAARTAELLGLTPRETRERLTSLLRALDLPAQFPPLDITRVLQAMRRDKKAIGGRLRLVLPVRIGEVRVVEEVPEEVAAEAIRLSR